MKDIKYHDPRGGPIDKYVSHRASRWTYEGSGETKAYVHIFGLDGRHAGVSAMINGERDATEDENAELLKLAREHFKV